MDGLGYQYLQARFAAAVFPVARPARLAPVTRMVASAEGLQVPKTVAPKSEQPLEHLLFALRYEGVNLALLAEVMPKLAAADLHAQLRATPSSAYVRKACYLWEWFTGQSLEDLPPVRGSYVPLFDPADYLTRAGQKNSKWRVEFNGLGTPDYCPIVRRTEAVETGLVANILGQTEQFLASLGGSYVDRALAWAYLSETDSSFAIERETPSQTKSETFVALLQQAHHPIPLTEDYLAELQSATLSNPFDRAACFRHEQNWLRGGGLRGAASVTYVPPAPELLHALMPSFLALAEQLPTQLEPITAALRLVLYFCIRLWMAMAACLASCFITPCAVPVGSPKAVCCRYPLP
jgi:hypothetical protein